VSFMTAQKEILILGSLKKGNLSLNGGSGVSPGGNKAKVSFSSLDRSS
jgi:hypothetical protein